MAVFDQNGVLVMGNKTPVTILHETLYHKGVTANYELIYSSSISSDPVFKYKVSALEFSAIGDGKTKKEAKHDAAAGLLRRMHGVPEKGGAKSDLDETVVASPYTGALKENYIGMLEEICMTNKIPFAEYRSIAELGPPHARIFRMECKLTSCTERATARTKKQAKHMAAQKMIDRVKGIMGDKFVPIKEKIVDYDNPDEPSILKDIENGIYQHDKSVLLSDMHNVFHLKKEEHRVPEEFYHLCKEPLIRFNELENPKEYLDNLVKNLEGICKTTVYPKSDPKEDAPIKDQKLLTAEKGSCGNIKSPDSNSTTRKILPIDNNKLVKPEQPQKNIINLHLKKIGLEDCLEDLDLDIGEVSNQQPNLTLDSNVEGVLQRASDSYKELFEDFSRKTGQDDRPLMIFLTIVCPQGSYVFSGLGSDLQEAERQGAIKALEFLRIMSLPRKEKVATAACC